MKSLKTVLIVVILGIVFIPISAFAADVRSGQDLTIDSDFSVDENLYIGAGNVRVESDVLADLSVIGGEVEVSSNITGDTILTGGNIIFSGHANDDLKIIGGTVIVSGTVEKDLVVVGGTIKILEGAQINGDLILIGGEAYFSGSVKNRTKIVAGVVDLNGTLNGASQITTQKITFNSKANVIGSLSYFAPASAYEVSGANLVGDIKFNQIESLKDSSFVKSTILNILSFWILLRFVTTLLLAFILVYIFKVFSQSTADFAVGNFLRSFLIGLSAIVLVPIISIILGVSLFAIPVSALLMLAYVFVGILSTAVSGIILGILLKKFFKKNLENYEVSFQMSTLGVVVLTLLQFMPIIGELTRIVFYLVAFGAISHYIYMNIRWSDSVNLNK